MIANLIINPQQGFNHPRTRAAFINAAHFSKDFEKKYIARFSHNQSSPFVNFLGWHRMIGGADSELLPEFTDINAEIINHNVYTVIDEKQFAKLQQQQVSKLFITGVFTDVCVIKTALDAFDHSIEPLVVADCCATLHGQDVHDAALKSLRRSIGDSRVLSMSEARQIVKSA